MLTSSADIIYQTKHGTLSSLLCSFRQWDMKSPWGRLLSAPGAYWSEGGGGRCRMKFPLCHVCRTSLHRGDTPAPGSPTHCTPAQTHKELSSCCWCKKTRTVTVEFAWSAPVQMSCRRLRMHWPASDGPPSLASVAASERQPSQHSFELPLDHNDSPVASSDKRSKRGHDGQLSTTDDREMKGNS